MALPGQDDGDGRDGAEDRDPERAHAVRRIASAAPSACCATTYPKPMMKNVVKTIAISVPCAVTDM